VELLNVFFVVPMWILFSSSAIFLTAFFILLRRSYARPD
jgi:hypothetical protein